MKATVITFQDSTTWRIVSRFEGSLGRGCYGYSLLNFGNWGDVVEGFVKGENLTDRQLLIAILQDVERKEGES